MSCWRADGELLPVDEADADDADDADHSDVVAAAVVCIFDVASGAASDINLPVFNIQQAIIIVVVCICCCCSCWCCC